jgi:AcrR family transcriptional regulator
VTRDTGPERSTRDALLDAALDQLALRGVLAGLNLREVADAVGVTPANIYHYFGSRQGLLRAALARETARTAVPIAEVPGATFVERRVRMFDVVATNPALALTALLALDGDPDFQPIPFLDATRAYYAGQVEQGAIAPDLDSDAMHLLGLASAIGFAIYGEAAARQLGVTVDELRDRVRSVYERVLRCLANRSGGGRR